MHDCETGCQGPGTCQPCKFDESSAAPAGSPLYGAIANKRDPGRVLIRYPGGEIGMPWRDAAEWANRTKEAARQADLLEMDKR